MLHFPEAGISLQNSAAHMKRAWADMLSMYPAKRTYILYTKRLSEARRKVSGILKKRLWVTHSADLFAFHQLALMFYPRPFVGS